MTEVSRWISGSEPLVEGAVRLSALRQFETLHFEREGVFRRILASVARQFKTKYAFLSLRDSDGCWAQHWYHSVEDSTGFMPYREKTIELAPEQQALADTMAPYYQQLAQHRIQP